MNAMAQFLLKDTAIALGVLIVGGVGLKALTGKSFEAESFEAKGYKGISASKIQVLEKYIENGGQALDYHELPYHTQRQLEMGKVHELLYQDVNRWLQDNAPNPHHAMPSWLSAETFNSDSYYPQEKFIWKINNIEYDWENEPEYFEDYYFSKLTVGVIVDSSEEGSGLHGIQFSTKQSPENILKIVKNKIERFASHLTNQSVKVISFDEELYDIIDISTPSISADEYNNGIEGVFGHLQTEYPYEAETFNADEDDENKRNIFVYEAYRDTINTFIGRFNTLEEAENYIYNEWINEVNDYLQEARSRREGTYISPLTKDLLKEKKEKGVLDWTERGEKYLKAQQSRDSQPLSDEQKDNLQYHEDNIDRWVSEWKIVSQTPKGSILQNPDYSRPELPYKMYEGYSQRYRDGYGNFPYIIFDPNFNPIGEE
jgi:hypothetical protein